jgi:hypothetical protein
VNSDQKEDRGGKLEMTTVLQKRWRTVKGVVGGRSSDDDIFLRENWVYVYMEASWWRIAGDVRLGMEEKDVNMEIVAEEEIVRSKKKCK